MKTEPIYDVIVIGGGPSGMMAAGRAGELGAKVLLLEKNKELGKKLSITGGGRCNITNATFDTREFLRSFLDSQKYLHSPFSEFSAKDTFTFFEEKGLPLVIEEKNRTFPKSQKASDVTNVMREYVKQNGVKVKTSTNVESVKKKRIKNDAFFSVETTNGTFNATYIVIATGGLASPETGSTGDGFRFLKELGHNVSKPSSNVVPLKTKEKWVHSLSGTSLANMKISFAQDGKVKIKKTGGILFTHFGVSGPLILNSSHEVKGLLLNGPVIASIDLFPDTDEGALDKILLELFEKNKNKKIKNILPELIPVNIVEVVLSFKKIRLLNSSVNTVTKEERKRLVKRMKDLTFEISGTLGFEKAVLSDGGVDLEEVNFKNMSSKLHPNLYLLGDILDINRPSGGFSLQLCWTTGFVAGTNIGTRLIDQRL